MKTVIIADTLVVKYFVKNHVTAQNNTKKTTKYIPLHNKKIRIFTSTCVTKSERKQYKMLKLVPNTVIKLGQE